MAQTNQPMGSSPLANMMQQGQVWRGPNPRGEPIGGPLGSVGGPDQQVQQGQGFTMPRGPMPMMPGMEGTPGLQAWGTPPTGPGALRQLAAGGGQTPQTGDAIAKMQQNLSSIQGMQPNQIPRMPGMQPPPGAPGQGPGGGKAPGTPGGAQQIKRATATLPGGPPPGAPAAGPGAGKGARQNPQMKQQIAQLPGAPGR